MTIANLKQLVKQMPESPGSYQFFDQSQKALYVGKAKNLKKRLLSYTDLNRHPARIIRMLELAQKLEVIPTTNETEALLLEFNLVQKLMPRFNILLRDDKSFPYILITEDGQITKHRGKKNRPGRYFGPFANVYDVNPTIEILKRSFLLRSCSDGEFQKATKPCMEYQIKRCSAPCVAMISKDDYQNLIQEVIDCLSGKSAKVQEQLAKKMQEYSQQFQYEKAAVMRDRIKALSGIQSKQNINLEELQDTDVITLVRKNNLACLHISFYRMGHNYGSKPYFITVDEDEDEAKIMAAFLGQFYLNQEIPKDIILSHLPEDVKNTQNLLSDIAKHRVKITQPKMGYKFSLVKDHLQNAEKYLEHKIITQLNDRKILLEIKKLFDLPSIPARIEVYDNSHISGEFMVGAMICAGSEGFVKNAYRKFNIRKNELRGFDDTAILKQVLTRRFKRMKEESGVKPDLVVIDGGKGQMSAAVEVFGELDIEQNFVCMSKGPNRNAGEEYFHQPGKESFTLPKTSPVIYYLQRLRDEAHRFAIGTHRARRAKSVTKSDLDEIADIGQSRKMTLLNHFGSVKKIREATIEDLSRVGGIGRSLAQKIIDHFGAAHK